MCLVFFFFFQAEDGIRDLTVTGVQTCALPICHRVRSADHDSTAGPGWPDQAGGRRWRASRRSEEHTSELQSQSNLVCRLLLEKKKIQREAPQRLPAFPDMAHVMHFHLVWAPTD